MLLGIQYLRAIAALMVVFHHALYRMGIYGNGAFDLEIEFGMGGVDIFFIISGFIMFYVTTQKTYTPLKFLKARIIRIAPNYWLWMALFVIIYPETTTVEHTVKSFLFIPAYHPDFETQVWYIWPPLIQGWTLNYEVYFYGVFAIGIWTGHRIVIVTTLLVGLIVLGIELAPTNAPTYVYTNPQLIEFLAGVWLAKLYLSDFRIPTWVGLGLSITGVMLFPFFQLFPIPDTAPAGSWVVNRGLPAFLLVSGVLVLEKARRIPNCSWLNLIGSASFTLYLSHVFILDAWAKTWHGIGLHDNLSDVLLLVSSIVASTVTGVILYRLIERPMLIYLTSRKRVPEST